MDSTFVSESMNLLVFGRNSLGTKAYCAAECVNELLTIAEFFRLVGT